MTANTIGENTQGQSTPESSDGSLNTSSLKTDNAWLCLRFTQLSLNSQKIAFSASSNNSIAPTAITDKQRVWQCNQLALLSGIRPDMGINHALMLAPELIMVERDIKLESQKLIELSYWAYRFSSHISIYNECTLLLEIGRSIKLFNGLNHLLNLINNDLSGFAIQTSLGLAYTPKAAYLLSFESPTPQSPQANVRQDKQLKDSINRLNTCPVEHLEIQQKVIDQLHNCGFENLDDINHIPNAELGHRFGNDFLHYLDQLWGRIADPQIALTPPENFEASADFAEPIRNLAWIKQQLDRLLNDLQQFITQRQLICLSFTWRFYHENNRLLKTVTIGLSATQNKFETFQELSNLKLASIQLDWEFSSIELSSTQLAPIQLFHDDLFDPKIDQQQFKQLIDKLSNRLGHNALFRVRVAPEHLPELCNDRQYAVQESSSNKYQIDTNANADTNNRTPADELLDQPLWLLENPQRLAQQHKQPLHEGPLSIIHGPDRVTSHWWSKLQSRDYFIARQHNGRLLWIFFDRGEKNWFLHGLFA